MTGVVGHESSSHDVQVVIGVDTHQDRHVAVAIDQQGVRLGESHLPANTYGFAELECGARSLGRIRAFGIEGTGSYGAGVARFLPVETTSLSRSIAPTGQFVVGRGRTIPPMRKWRRAQCSRE